ncbi:hypothetical protein H2198_008475 [Neophaeococcomyces mojaviensis]|uniref:Uncharacterized protein n=1 Tax=Neophaeococcomyces mojaviensis TaxID=3383035 RepID=A0ACC2ZXH4_9EURO|nr:hypothetical protein H2198_008475 [Knufia sp. JES_112]
MACLECRRRRIRCDGARPKCHHCARLSKHCEYAVCELPRGPKRRSVRELAERLATVEAQLKNAIPLQRADPALNAFNSPADFAIDLSDIQGSDRADLTWSFPEEFNVNNVTADFPLITESPGWLDTSNANIPPITLDSQTLLDKGQHPNLREVQELTNLFFDEVHPCMPFVHPAKHNYPQFVGLNDQPPLCLEYAMWSLAASRSPKYEDRAQAYYRNARLHLEHDEMQDGGLGITTLAHLQAWILVTCFECENATPARAWMSNRRSIALSNMLGLHQQDSPKDGKYKMLKPPVDTAEAEERRRTFWYLYICDRWASAGTGNSVAISEDEISTLLPTLDNTFLHHASERARTLEEAASNGLNPTESSLTAAVLAGRLLDQVTQHLRQVKIEAADPGHKHYWLRHQQLDNTITKFLLHLPDHIRSENTRDPLAFFVNMCIHEFTISLFQAATSFAQRGSPKSNILALLRSRAHRAADEIVSIMRTQSFMSLRRMSAFTPSCLYVAATVFINDVNQGNEVEYAIETIRFLLHTISLFRRFYKTAQMFVAQLLLALRQSRVDLEFSAAERASMLELPPKGIDFDTMGLLFSTDTLLTSK